MNSAWFTPSAAHWLMYLSLFSLFSVLGHYVTQGRHRKAVTGAMTVGAVIGLVLAVLTIVGAMQGQPRHVLVSLGVPGTVMTVVFLAILVWLPRGYAVAELRRMSARDF